MKSLSEHLAHVRAGHDLPLTQVDELIAELIDPEIEDGVKGEFLRALHVKGETGAEIAAFVQSMLRRAVDPDIDPERVGGPLLDICGTGGDRLELFNVSTTAMFILAAGGAVVVKHGNRGISSKCGGADVLEQLGVRIDLPRAELRRCVMKHGLGFLFAPVYHPAFKALAPVRKKLAAENVLTIFNLLGPLLNPARPAYQLVGVFSRSLLQKFAETFHLLGRRHAWAVHGVSDVGSGVDEVSTMGPTAICKFVDGRQEFARVNPEDFGLARASVEELRGGGCENNARILRGILNERFGGRSGTWCC